MRQAQGVLQVSRAVLLRFMLPQDLRGGKRLIFGGTTMKIELYDLIPLVEKASKYDAIISYIKTKNYIDKDDILAFAGELSPEEDSKEDTDNA